MKRGFEYDRSNSRSRGDRRDSNGSRDRDGDRDRDRGRGRGEHRDRRTDFEEAGSSRYGGGNGDRGGGGSCFHDRGGSGVKRTRDDDDGRGRSTERPRGRAGRGGRGRGGGGRGRGRGRPRPTFEERQRERELELDFVDTRAALGKNSKKGKAGLAVQLLGNYFALKKRTDWTIYHYRVDYIPEEMDTRIKKGLLREHEQTLGAYVFDGSSLWMSNRLNPEPIVLTSIRDGRHTELRIRMVAQLDPSDVTYLQLYNIIVRRCLECMDLEELGRNFYDRHQAIQLSAHRLELWPGYKTSMRNHENSLLLGCEITHRVLRTDSCLDAINQCRNNNNFQGSVKYALVGTIVMTHYNRKTYRVDDIEWGKSPADTFKMGDRNVSFAEYYQERYQLRVTDLNQPMLMSRPKKKDFHRGQTGNLFLIPEFCQMTGLTDEMRGNFQLMKSVNFHLHLSPENRVAAIKKFMERLNGAPKARDELQRWGMELDNHLVGINGRLLTKENILFGQQRSVPVGQEASWDSALRTNSMMTTKELHTWVVIVPQRDAQAVDEVISTMTRVGEPLHVRISRPQVIRINDIRIPSYMIAIDQANADYKGKLQLVFVVLPKVVVDIYAAVKKRCSVDFGVASQCFVAKNATDKRKLMSVATKVVIQIGAKLGAEPWNVKVPLTRCMIVGFDVYHCPKRKNKSVGAIVSTTLCDPTSHRPTMGRYYSTVSSHHSKEELSSNLCRDFTKCLHAFKHTNKYLPDRIIMYRDGVGEGQLEFVYNTELRQIQESIRSVYVAEGREPPKFTFIVVTKRLLTRIFKTTRGHIENPDAGTVVDDVITFPERFDFYLISQHSRQGTVSPTAYNVLFDKQGIPDWPDKLQVLTYKLCHMYFNWSGTVTVPAPCQYAHKLAYLTGIALQGEVSSENLSHVLHFL